MEEQKNKESRCPFANFKGAQGTMKWLSVLLIIVMIVLLFKDLWVALLK